MTSFHTSTISYTKQIRLHPVPISDDEKSLPDVRGKRFQDHSNQRMNDHRFKGRPNGQTFDGSRKRKYHMPKRQHSVYLGNQSSSFNPEFLEYLVHKEVKNALEKLDRINNVKEEKFLSRIEELEKNCNTLAAQVVEKCDKLKEVYEKLEIQINNAFILPTNFPLNQGFIVAPAPAVSSDCSVHVINDDKPNNEIINIEKEPIWFVSKEKCKLFLEKSQNQITNFLSFYLPEIYNFAELISPAHFPEAEIKTQEIKSVIQYFWRETASDFRAKEIEKEFQSQRYKVTRKLYHLLKTQDTCIMGSDGKIFNNSQEKVRKVILADIGSNLTSEWLIPEKFALDDYVIGAKKDDSGRTHIYKLDLIANSTTLLHTKRK